MSAAAPRRDFRGRFFLGPKVPHEGIVRYFGGAGVGVGASRRMTIPAGVRRDSNGVVSGVGGAGAGVPFSAT